MRLFIADDSEILRTRLIEMLSELKDIEIIGHAEDSHEAVEAVERLRPNVVILDIRMPKGDGILALETIKRSKHAPVVIMFTNYPYPQYRKKCMEAGADYFFSKSTEFEGLMEVLRQMTQNSRKAENRDGKANN